MVIRENSQPNFEVAFLRGDKSQLLTELEQQYDALLA